VQDNGKACLHFAVQQAPCLPETPRTLIELVVEYVLLTVCESIVKPNLREWNT